MARTSQPGASPAAIQNSTYTYAADLQASDSYAIVLSPPIAGYVVGQEFLFKANTANTGAGSLNVDSKGAITIKKANDQDLVTGDIEVGQIVKVVYDGTNFQMESQSAIAPGTGDVTTSGTQTLTNKRITNRTGTTTSSATPTINTDNVDYYSLTAQAVDITSFTTNLSGTPTENQRLWISITGTATRAIAWGTSFEAGAVALPITTVGTTRLDVGFVWNTISNHWRCMASG